MYTATGLRAWRRSHVFLVISVMLSAIALHKPQHDYVYEESVDISILQNIPFSKPKTLSVCSCQVIMSNNKYIIYSNDEVIDKD